jgi:hypothetical protein
MGNPPVNVSQVIGNPLTNLLQGIPGEWQPIGEFVIECQRLLATMKNSSEGTVLVKKKNVYNGTYLSEAPPLYNRSEEP